MRSKSIFESLACALFTLPLIAACSSAPGDGPSAASASQAVTDDSKSEHCNADEPCAVGYYCAPSDSANVCGSGTCTASPGACPMIDAPACGCDGNVYLNACWATIGQSGQAGTVSTGAIFVAPTMSTLVGTWSRESGEGSNKTFETLVLGSDSTYTLTEASGCSHDWSSRCAQSESDGTYTLSTVGILLDATTSTNAAGIANEFYLENTCPIGGPLQLVGAEPPGSNTMVTLTSE